MWNTGAVSMAIDALHDVDPIKAVATLAVVYAAYKLVRYFATAPVIPTVWVPLEPGELFELQYHISMKRVFVR